MNVAGDQQAPRLYGQLLPRQVCRAQGDWLGAREKSVVRVCQDIVSWRGPRSDTDVNREIENFTGPPSHRPRAVAAGCGLDVISLRCNSMRVAHS